MFVWVAGNLMYPNSSDEAILADLGQLANPAPLGLRGLSHFSGRSGGGSGKHARNPLFFVFSDLVPKMSNSSAKEGFWPILGLGFWALSRFLGRQGKEDKRKKRAGKGEGREGIFRAPKQCSV